MAEVKYESTRQNSEILETADRLHSAAIHLLRRLRKLDSATAEGPARLSALSVLVLGSPKTLGELAAAEQVKPPTMSRIVAGLEHSRLVAVSREAQDARRMRIVATPKGTRLLQQGRRRRVESLASNLERLNRDQLSKLCDVVEMIEEVLRRWG